MPNRATHEVAGAASGAAFALLRVCDAPMPYALAEVLGGALGGWVGGLLPDVLEPATTPNHRKVAHSVVAGGTLTLARLAEWQATCRTEAQGCVTRASGLPLGSDARRRADWDALVWRFLAGLLAGLVAGYASHLMLDAGTAKGLPLLA
jgi:xanthosine utilization system XapX-like protein